MESDEISVHLLPSLVNPESLQGGIVVVIDVLRASTTIVEGLAHGAVRFVPCSEVKDARTAANGMTRKPLLGGERKGKKISEFDLDNSPASYTSDVCRGQSIIFTTTNGTRALKVCQQAERVLIGAFTNLSAVCQAIQRFKGETHLVCAGTDGEVALEDVLLAGCLYRCLKKANSKLKAQNDACLLASQFAKVTTEDSGMILRVFEGSRGGLNLIEAGFEADLARCAKLDLHDIVPEWDARQNTISISETTH